MSNQLFSFSKFNSKSLFITVLITGILIIDVSNASAKSNKKTETDQLLQIIKESLTEPPKDQEICFSPDEDCDIKLLKFIQSAKVSVDVAIYDINLKSVVDELIRQSKTIKIRIIVDKRQSKGKRSLVPFLIKNGINIRYGRQRGIQHDKFTIIDNKMVEAGSFNYTNHASQANSENQFYNASPYVVMRYRQQFDKMWIRAVEPVLTIEGKDLVIINKTKF